MEPVNFEAFVDSVLETTITALTQPQFYIQVGVIALIYAIAWVLARQIRIHAPVLDDDRITAESHPLLRFIARCGNLIFPLIAILMLRITVDLGQGLLDQAWLVRTALVIALLLLFNSAVNDFVQSRIANRVFKLVGVPLLLLHMLGLLGELIRILESISLSIGNIDITAYGIARVAIFGTLLFWFGRISSRTGREILSRQEELDERTREVATKLFEVVLFVVIFLLLLNIMGINLTALAVFGGAVGVGLGFGLQAIASNFISGIIILLDRSVSIGDYVEIADGQAGVVRQFNLRSTTLETFEGKDIIVPNEKFIVETLTNWTHKDKNQATEKSTR